MNSTLTAQSYAGKRRPTGLPFIQHRIGTGRSTTQGKGDQFPLPHVTWQQPECGYLDLCCQNWRHKSDQPGLPDPGATPSLGRSAHWPVFSHLPQPLARAKLGLIYLGAARPGT